VGLGLRGKKGSGDRQVIHGQPVYKGKRLGEGAQKEKNEKERERKKRKKEKEKEETREESELIVLEGFNKNRKTISANYIQISQKTRVMFSDFQ